MFLSLGGLVDASVGCAPGCSNHSTRSARPDELLVDGVSTGARARYRRCCMVTEGPAEVLHGRREEREALDRLLEAVRGGQSRVLVVSGEAGGWQDGAVGVCDRLRVGVPGDAGGRCGVGDGARVRGVAAVVRADAGSPGPASWPSAGCARGGVRAAGGGRAGSVSGGVGGAEPVGGGGRGAAASVCG